MVALLIFETIVLILIVSLAIVAIEMMNISFTKKAIAVVLIFIAYLASMVLAFLPFIQ